MRYRIAIHQSEEDFNFFVDTRPTPMPSGSVLVFVGTIRRAFRVLPDMRNAPIQIHAILV